MRVFHSYVYVVWKHDFNPHPGSAVSTNKFWFDFVFQIIIVLRQLDWTRKDLEDDRPVSRLGQPVLLIFFFYKAVRSLKARFFTIFSWLIPGLHAAARLGISFWPDGVSGQQTIIERRARWWSKRYIDDRTYSIRIFRDRHHQRVHDSPAIIVSCYTMATLYYYVYMACSQRPSLISIHPFHLVFLLLI